MSCIMEGTSTELSNIFKTICWPPVLLMSVKYDVRAHGEANEHCCSQKPS